MIASLSSQFQTENKLVKILDFAKNINTTSVTITTKREWHMEVFDFFLKHPKIDRLKISGSTIFIIKEMRIELKPVDLHL
jgi:hypothetical protein